jgi:tripartite-type tricarboxylate transporter receptor subunit TctC
LRNRQLARRQSHTIAGQIEQLFSSSSFAWCVLLLLAALSMGATRAYAQSAANWPNKPLRVIVPYPPGAATDTITRIMMEKLAQRLAQTIIVENKGGANSAVGTAFVARAEPDGYTLLSVLAAYAVNPHLHKMAYQPEDLIPVSKLADLPNFLFVSNRIPANTLEELLDYGRRHPGKLNYASSGTGSSAHMLGASLSLRSGVPLQHVPYKGSALVLTDILSGEVAFVFSSMVVFMPHVKEGRLKAIAISSPQRWSTEPNIPTMEEAGFPGFNMVSWAGMMAPKGTSRPIIERLAREIAVIVKDPEVRERLMKGGLVPESSSPEEFAALIARDSAMYGEIIRAGKISAD